MRQDGGTTQLLRPVSIELAPVRYPESPTRIRRDNTRVFSAIAVQHGVLQREVLSEGGVEL